MLVYVDDVMLSGRKLKAVGDTQRMLMGDFSATDFVKANTFVAIQEPEMGQIGLIQGRYIQ